jgi:catechol 2,3-dioxygenase-like lactoylglutathione lyase family enzyme
MNTTNTQDTGRASVSFGHAAVNTPDLDRFRRFYEDVLGLRLVHLSRPADSPFRRVGAFTDRYGHRMVLLAFEVPGYASGLADDQIGQRGRIDHLAFEAANDIDFAEILTRLVDAGASSGEVDHLGPVRSCLFIDPDGAHGNVQVNDPTWRPSPDDEVPDPAAISTLLAADA